MAILGRLAFFFLQETSIHIKFLVLGKGILGGGAVGGGSAIFVFVSAGICLNSFMSEGPTFGEGCGWLMCRDRSGAGSVLELAGKRVELVASSEGGLDPRRPKGLAWIFPKTQPCPRNLPGTPTEEISGEKKKLEMKELGP